MSDVEISQIYVKDETQISESGEADLHRHVKNCTKNPGHNNFIPVEAFTLDHLPVGHRDNDLYELIKVVADLTVRIGVTMTSPHRPEFWPNTKDPYPAYDKRGEEYLRCGTGKVSGIVIKYTDGFDDDGDEHEESYTTCWCKKCQQSGTPSRVWWEFFVHTATHVVFDEIEANHTSIRFFYDTDKSPLVSVDGVSAHDVEDGRDWCLLNCVTCDKNLGDRLSRLWKSFEDVWERVRPRYVSNRDVDKFNFIVSHPHGCSKQVSIGQWVDKNKVGERNHKFTYTTCTCPGSSGATVYCMGYGHDTEWWFYQLVHSGSLNAELNQSGAGEVH